MKKSKTPSFITEIPLKVNSTQERTLLARFEAGRQLYNACLGEALRRKNLMQESIAYQDARKLPRQVNGEPNKERQQAFHACDAHFGFRQYDLQKFAKETQQRCWIGDHLDSLSTQTISDRAFRAVQKLIFDPKCKRVRFKGKNQFDSIEGKTNTSGIRFKGNQIIWGKLRLDCIIDSNDLVIMHGLKHQIKYCRLIKRKLNGRIRFYVQLICQGFPYQKFESPKHVVGLDLGPSTIAHVSDSHTKLERFCLSLEDRQKEIRRLQRKMDRQRRANNPQNYNSDGTVKAGRKTWHNGNLYQKTRDRLAEIQRKQAAHRKSLHGFLINFILKIGCFINTEKLSYKAFQRQYGKSVGFRAPGKFMERLRYKAVNAGGVCNEFPTYTTKLSQYCHKCGQYTKKPLSQRVHTCCDLNIQRDVYSAFLALNIKGKSLDVKAVNDRFMSLETKLRSTSGSLSESQTESGSATHSPRCKASDRFDHKVLMKSHKAQDVVDGEQLWLFPVESL